MKKIILLCVVGWQSNKAIKQLAKNYPIMCGSADGYHDVC